MEPIKKIIVAKDINSLIEKEESFFKRANIKIITVSSNKEALLIHKKERADLIIVNLDTPDIDGEKFCSLIRDDARLRNVSIIMVHSNIKYHIEMQSRCRANIFICRPIIPSILFEKSHQLLNIAQREYLRAPVVVKVHGKYKGKPFLCISENISASGMLFQTERIIEKGDNIICSFFLPDSKNILTEAEVVRIVEKKTEYDTYYYGIKFLNLNINDKYAIEMYTKEKNKNTNQSLD